MNDVANDILMHFGVGKLDGAPGRGSGRYPLGSGDNPNQRAGDFMSRVNKLRKEGLTEKEVAAAVGCIGEDGQGNTSLLRANYSIARAEHRSMMVAKVKELEAKGLSRYKIGDELGISESTVRSLLNEEADARANASMNAAKFLKEQVDKKGMVEVGAGVCRELDISQEKMNEALKILEIEGYPTHRGRVEQATNPNNKTTISVLCPPGTPHSDIFNKIEDIHTVTEYKALDIDGQDVFMKLQRPTSLSSKRILARYGQEGSDKEGVVEIRPGVKDLSLEGSHYAQVRIMVDGTHYVKGMAVYGDPKDFPPGVDLIFNSNKKEGTPLLSKDPDAKQLLKVCKDDPDNPFGALIKDPNKGGQYYYTDKDGKRKLSPLNKTRDEGDWDDWADKVPSQFLAKQPMKLVNRQLDLTKAVKRAEFDEICSLTNPTLKKQLLKEFADNCDSDAVKLKAIALPKQKYKVMLPVTTLSDKECYCPSIKDGTTVALIRYPHGGTFEIPVLKVNNKNPQGKRMITPGSIDGIGVNKKVADRLSGADFDGDTVMVVPFTRSVKVHSTPELPGLKGFDDKLAYPYRKGMKVMSKKYTQNQMGEITNLITDMTIAGATNDELARAVKHSMVVIDAHKHKLDYKRSEAENGIPELKKKYQMVVDAEGKEHTSAATLISRAKGQKSVPKRKGQPIINPDGSLSYKLADDLEYTYTTKRGKVVTKQRTQKSTQMAEAKDARTLIGKYDTVVEHAYADFANYHKALANEARKVMINTKDNPYNPAAKKQYQKEFDSLNNQLSLAKKNQPRERMAQIITQSRIKAKKEAYPDLEDDKKELKKLKQKELTRARQEVGAKRRTIKISDKEYEAIQKGAISPSKLREILKYADKDELRKQAMPRTKKELSPAQVALIRSLRSRDVPVAEIAERLGVSPSTISKASKS